MLESDFTPYFGSLIGIKIFFFWIGTASFEPYICEGISFI